MDTTFEEQLRSRKLTIQTEQAELVQRMQGLDKQLGAIDILLSEFGATPPIQHPLANLEEQPTTAIIPETLTGKTVVEGCRSILSREKRPMTLSELVSALGEGGIKLKAKAPKRSVATLIYNRPEFIRTAPGTFALAGAQHCASNLAKQGAVVRLNTEGAIRLSAKVLMETGRAMHVRELFSALKARGFKSNAKRPEAMLSGTLKRSKMFRLIGNDTWDLTNRNGGAAE